MSDSVLEKQKHSRRFTGSDGYLALLFGIGACFLLFACLNITSDFWYTSRSFIYPLVVLSHSPLFSSLFGLSALVTLAGTAIFAAWRRANLIVVIFACLMGVGLLGAALIVRVFLAQDIAPQHTLMYQGQTYHLAIVWNSGGMDAPVKSYVVFQCDEIGWLCHRHVSPYSYTYEFDEYKRNTRFEKFYPSDELFIDADESLKLRVGDEVYLVNSNSGFRK